MVEPPTLAEVVYVLVGVYGYPARRIRAELLDLIHTDAIRLEKALLERAVTDALAKLSPELDLTGCNRASG